MSARDPAWDVLWAEAKRADMVELARRLGARLTKSGPHWIGPCPLGCASKDGFIVNQKKGFLCRPSGAHGDAVDMVEHVQGVSKAEALAYITGKPLPGKDPESASPPPPSRTLPPTPQVKRPARKEDAKPATTTAQALALFHQGVDPRGTLGERYLNQERKLELPADLCGRVLRWHPGVGAMLALFRDILTGEPRAITRIFLDHDARMIERKFHGAAIILDSFDAVLEGLHIGAGLETCMTGRERRNFKPAWALGSDHGVANFPVLSGVECLTLIQENDDSGANQRACRTCALRWDAAGREVLIDVPKPGFKDINDVIRGKGAPHD
jgi:CHC2 zinc finger